MEITFRIDPSYASPTEMVSLINAMQGLAATMGATMTNPAGMSVRASPSMGGGTHISDVTDIRYGSHFKERYKI
jgi:hypothetical protein